MLPHSAKFFVVKLFLFLRTLVAIKINPRKIQDQEEK